MTKTQIEQVVEEVLKIVPKLKIFSYTLDQPFNRNLIRRAIRKATRRKK